MNTTLFTYKDKEKALFDLKLFSRQYANEGKTLYLFSNTVSKLWICKEIAPTITSDMLIEAMAINGVVFLPSDV
jgi:hypothetical protein